MIEKEFSEWHRANGDNTQGILWVDKLLKSAWDMAYTAGAEAMRQKAVKVCETPIDEVQVTDQYSQVGYRDWAECAEAIKELKL